MFNPFKRFQVLKDSSILAGGAGFGQVLMILSYPLLTRLYSAEAFGILAIVVALSGLFSHAGALRYELAIHLPEQARNGYTVFLVAILSAVFVAVGLYVCVLLAELLRAKGELSWGVGALIWFVPVLVFTESVQRALTYWGARQGQMQVVAIASIVQAAGNILVALVLAILGAGALGLVLGQIVGPVLAIGLLVLYLVIKWENRPAITSTDIKREARRFQEIPRFGVPQGLAYSIGANIPHLLLAGFFGLEVAGLYLLAQKVMRHPADMVAEALRQAFLRRMREWIALRQITVSMLKAMAGLFVVSFPGAVIIMAAGPWLFEFVFGVGWGSAGEYARYLLVFVLSGLVSMPVVAAIPALGMQRLHFFYEVIAAAGRTAGLIVGYALGSDLAAIGLYAAIGALGHTILVVLVLRKARIRDSRELAAA